ncbi:hypothetical protein FHL15_006302 [Xylaria flabelliformis]|uniref:Uncharacterized protein n=1 Tax=Xylaria flabelliformis TaxID=2512241 RepID=A0A553HY72_9PEZI|nr:hypothetical protein FHL15_006302 [Xylaria flabelliformis]
MDLKSATTRLRRTFAYPSDTTTTSPSSSRYQSDDSDTDGPALDEQEQEELIQSLVLQNAKRNAQFRIFLLCLPALSTIPYFLVLFGGVAGFVSRDPSGGGGGDRGRERRRSAADIWIALLALSSLASTAWTLWSLPPGVTGIRVLDAWVGSSKDDDGTSTTTLGGGGGGGLGPMGANARRRRRASAGSHSFFWSQHHRSPLQQYLPFLNIALCSLLILAGFLSSSQRSAAHQHWGHVGLANLPALIYVVVLVAKMLMGSIDPERDLSALRYEYKGA